MSDIDVSVLILVKNGHRYLPCLLEIIFSQRTNFRFEVIVVDSGSTDQSLNILKGYQLRLYQIEASEFNHGLTRNLAISKANGDYVVLITQDALPINEDWLETMVVNIKEDQRIAGLYCRQVPRDNADLLTKINVNNSFAARNKRIMSVIDDRTKYNTMSEKEKYIFTNFDNVCSCIRKSIWEKIPFESLDFAEDLDWSKRVLESGYKILYIPETAVIHSHRLTPVYFYKRSYLHHKQLYRLFGFKPFNSTCSFLLKLSLSGLICTNYLYKSEKNILKLIIGLPKAILVYMAGLLGQYQGAK